MHTRRALAGYLDDMGATAELVHESILALDEACANVIRHAFPRNVFPDGEGTYRISADLDGRELVIVVEDDGVGFNPFEATGLGAGRDSEAGRGLGLIRQLMTSVEVESPRPGGGTRLCMRRNIDVAGSFLTRPAQPR
jgi:anti-sigma regulatory factor (Ser/Thr protein kinase)